MSYPLANSALITDLADDSGTGLDGSVVDAAFLGELAQSIDDAVYDADNPSVLPKDITGEVVTGRGGEANLNARFVSAEDRLDALESASNDFDPAGTAGETIADRQLCYLSDGAGGRTAGAWYKADADTAEYSSTAKALAFCIGGAAAAAVGSFRQVGLVTGLGGLVAGSVYYASGTAGSITATPPANAVMVGVAASSTSLVMSPQLASLARIEAAETDIATLEALTSGANGSLSTIAARLLVSLQTNGYLQNPYPKELVHTIGTGSHTGRASGMFDQISAAVANSGAAATTVWTKSLVANTLDANGKTLRVRMWGTCAANGNTKTVRFVFGGTTVVCFSFSGTSDWFVDVVVQRRTASTQSIGAHPNRLSGDPVVTTAAETLTGAVTVSVTLQGAFSSDITLQGLSAVIE